MFALIAACGGDGDQEGDFPAGNGAVAVATVTQMPPATATPRVEEVLRGFIYPIEGGCMPQGDQLMPNAPRTYRLGTHEGLDFYGTDNCTPISLGTPIVAPKQGRIIRIDTDYVGPTPAEMTALLADPDNEQSLDKFRGRQIWIDHGGGVVTRYCHMSAVSNELKVDDIVTPGTVLGVVGESGTPESVSNPGSQYHLHWEVRIGDSYLGAGMEPAQVRALYQALFEPQAP